MAFESEFLLALGSLLLMSLVTHLVGRKTFLPRVTLLMLFGLAIGPNGAHLIPTVLSDNFELIADMALLTVGFLLGGKLVISDIKTESADMLWISVVAALVTAFVVASVMYVFGVPLELAIVFGCIASATDAAAIFDVVSESRKESRFSRLLLGIVALDDIWALLIFAVGIAVISSINGAGATETLLHVAWDIGGAVLIGGALGIPAAHLTGRIKPGQPIIAEALGLVFLCGGIAIFFEVSFLIASMVMGMMIANLAKHHDYPFHAIEDVEWPFMLVFFVLAGASLEVDMLSQVGLIGIGYVILRAFGKYLGALIGGKISGAQPNIQSWMGAALLPQAGIAIGLALVATQYFPEYKQILLTVIVSSTVFFEIVGPIITRLALYRGEISPTEK